jgi:hypothetical protein
MPIAVGIYLPFTLSVPILFGGLARLGSDIFITQKFKKENNLTEIPNEKKQILEEKKEAVGGKGVLFSSGLIAGEALMGVIVAALVFGNIDISITDTPLDIIGFVAFLAVGAIMVRISFGDLLKSSELGKNLGILKEGIIEEVQNLRKKKNGNENLSEKKRMQECAMMSRCYDGYRRRRMDCCTYLHGC